MIGAFTKNTLITFITRIVTVILGLGTTVIISRVLGPEGQGVYSMAILLPSLLVIFCNFGITSSTVYFTARKKYLTSEIFGNNIILTLLISGLSFLIGILIIYFLKDQLFPGVKVEYLLLSLLFIPVSLYFDFISHILIGLQELKKYNTLSFFQGFILLVVTAYFLPFLNLGVKAAIIAQVVTFALVALPLTAYVYKKTNGFSLKVNKNYLKDAFSYGSKSYVASIFTFLNYRINLFVINIFLNPVSVGFYAVAGKLSEGIWMLSLSAATVLFPRVASENDKNTIKEFTPIVCRNVLFITFLMVFVLFVFARPVIVSLYSAKFLESVKTFQILLVGALFVSGWRILANDLIAQGRPILNTYVTAASVILNIILTIILTPMWGLEGAAAAATTSYIFMFIVIAMIYIRISGNKLNDVIILKKSDYLLYKNILLHLKRSNKL